MNKERIMAMQRRIGTTPDSFWGPQSIAACQRHIRGMMPRPHPFPLPNTSSMEAFYGPPGVPGGYSPPMGSFTPPFQVYLYGDKRRPVQTISCHVKLVHSLERVFGLLRETFPTEADRDHAGVNKYYGVYNPRRMRGGTSWSKHAWAAAIDLDAPRNGNNTHWPTRSNMPLESMECFAREGWMPAGAFWGRDSMHAEASR